VTLRTYEQHLSTQLRSEFSGGLLWKKIGMALSVAITYTCRKQRKRFVMTAWVATCDIQFLFSVVERI
jgi:hypothetical protein